MGRRAVIGILGGMGPAATVDLFDRIVRATPAAKDQDHLRILIDNNPAVPDRTAAILEGGPDPLPLLQAGVQELARRGAELLAIPCNTAHHFLSEMQAVCPVPILDMIAETAHHIRLTHGDGCTVGILATTGTVGTGLYQRALEVDDLAWMLPSDAEQEALMDAIYGPQGIKAGAAADGPRAAIQEIGSQMAVRGAEAFVLGCTEIPLVIGPNDLVKPSVASNQVLADVAVQRALAAESLAEPQLVAA